MVEQGGAALGHLVRMKHKEGVQPSEIRALC